MARSLIVVFILVMVAVVNAASGSKYSAEANSPVLETIDDGDNLSLKKNDDRLYRVHKLNVFWNAAQQFMRGEQKLKKLKNELKVLDKEVLKKKQQDVSVDFNKFVDTRLTELIDKIGLPAEHFTSVFEISKDTVIDGAGLNTKENHIGNAMFEEHEAESLWQRAVTSNLFSKEELDQLRNELERLEHRLAKKRHIEMQREHDKKDDDLKRRLKDVTYKADKQRKDIESRFFSAHSEL
ncbi:hypothetical protein HDE_11679 [Halotydeus destructor]|nr:hypothetical protein HDE_11679 [Halotydeus destructor]